MLGPRSVETASREWIVENLASHLLAVAGVPRRLVRYEDLVAAPQQELAAILRFLGEPEDEAARVLDGDSLDVKAGHAISGNPLRFKHGPLPISPDEKWQTGLSRADRRRVMLRTFPLATAYGYARPGRSRLMPGR
jgi:hypothetical protein